MVSLTDRVAPGVVWRLGKRKKRVIWLFFLCKIVILNHHQKRGVSLMSAITYKVKSIKFDPIDLDRLIFDNYYDVIFKDNQSEMDVSDENGDLQRILVIMLNNTI